MCTQLLRTQIRLKVQNFLQDMKPHLRAWGLTKGDWGKGTNPWMTDDDEKTQTAENYLHKINEDNSKETWELRSRFIQK